MRLYPLEGQTLGCGYLFASHILFEPVFVSPRTLQSLAPRKIPPHIGKHVVLRHFIALVAHTPEAELGRRIPLLGC